MSRRFEGISRKGRCGTCGIAVALPPSHRIGRRTAKQLATLPPLKCDVCREREDKHRRRHPEEE